MCELHLFEQIYQTPASFLHFYGRLCQEGCGIADQDESISRKGEENIETLRRRHESDVCLGGRYFEAMTQRRYRSLLPALVTI